MIEKVDKIVSQKSKPGEYFQKSCTDVCMVRNLSNFTIESKLCFQRAVYPSISYSTAVHRVTMTRTVLAIATNCPEIKEFDFLAFGLKIDFLIFYTPRLREPLSYILEPITTLDFKT